MRIFETKGDTGNCLYNHYDLFKKKNGTVNFFIKRELFIEINENIKKNISLNFTVSLYFLWF